MPTDPNDYDVCRYCGHDFVKHFLFNGTYPCSGICDCMDFDPPEGRDDAPPKG